MSSSSSDSEGRTPAKQNVQPSTSKQDNSSDSDFVHAKKKPKGSKHLPQQDDAFSSSSKLLFQKMLMGSNNKFAELLKNKQNMADKNKKTLPSPAKGILKTPDKQPKQNDADFEFSPIASSTQIREISMTETPLVKVKKIKQLRKERVSESSSDEQAREKQRKVASELDRKNSTNKDQTLRNLTDSETEAKTEKKKKVKSKLKKVQKDSSNSSSEKSSSNRNKQSKNLKQSVKKTKKADSSINTQGLVSNKINHNRSLSYSESENDFNSKSNKVKKRKQKTLSSESESDNQSILNKLSSQFKKFESYYKNVKKIDKECSHLDNIKLSKGIFMVQIPKNLDPKLLIGTKISMNQTTRVPEGSRKYECIPSLKPKDIPITIFTNAEKVRLIDQIGNIKIQKHMKSKHIPDLTGTANNRVAFPENLKQRHPLFGADYSDKVNLEEHIQEKLKAAIESYTKQKKKKKKHKKREEDIACEKEPEEIFKFLNQTDTVGKKVKIKKEVESDTTFENSDTKIKKEKKRVKVKQENLDLETEELHIKEEKVKKHKRHVDNYNDDDELDTFFKDTNKKIKSESIDPNSFSRKLKKENLDDSLGLINEILLSKSMEISTKKGKEKEKTSPQCNRRGYRDE